MREQLQPCRLVLQGLADRLYVHRAALNNSDETRALVFVRLLDDLVTERGIPVDDLCDEGNIGHAECHGQRVERTSRSGRRDLIPQATGKARPCRPWNP